MESLHLDVHYVCIVEIHRAYFWFHHLHNNHRIISMLVLLVQGLVLACQACQTFKNSCIIITNVTMRHQMVFHYQNHWLAWMTPTWSILWNSKKEQTKRHLTYFCTSYWYTLCIYCWMSQILLCRPQGYIKNKGYGTCLQWTRLPM